MRPVLIMSSERSGSNLLCRMLGAHPAVSAPPPPHLWLHLARVAERLGPLDDAGVAHLLRLACRMTEVKGSAHGWNLGLTPTEARDHLRSPTLSGVCAAVYAARAARESRVVWVAKENRLFDHAVATRLALPDARIVYLVRDGRDYACSVRRVPSHDQQVSCIAAEWADEQRRSLLAEHDLAPHGAVLRIHYENLLSAPEDELRRLCRFLDLRFAPAMLESHRDDSATHEAAATAYWQNLARPVMAGNHGKFRSELSARQVRTFEAIAGPELTALGYPLEHPEAPLAIGRVRRAVDRTINAVQRRLQRRRLLAEPGRREREAMLREIHAAPLPRPTAATPTPQSAAAAAEHAGTSRPEPAKR